MSDQKQLPHIPRNMHPTRVMQVLDSVRGKSDDPVVNMLIEACECMCYHVQQADAKAQQALNGSRRGFR